MSWYAKELHDLLECVENCGDPFAFEKEFQMLLKGVAESEYDRGYEAGYNDGQDLGYMDGVADGRESAVEN